MKPDAGPVTLPVIALVLCAALLHATWNALLKSGGDRFRSIVVMSAASSLACLPALAVLPLPQPAAWPAVILSSALHVGYNLFLVRCYAHGDLGQMYPVARGSSPVLVLVAALLVAHEQPAPLAVLGIILVSGGILALAGHGRASRRGLSSALATGVFIAAYTVTDGIGGRRSDHPLSYAMWLFVLDGFPMVAIYAVRRGGLTSLVQGDRESLKGVIGGIVSVMAYAAVIYAASVSPMGPVSALRETSVVFAALIGRRFLGETMTARRLSACLLVAVGAVLLGQS